MKKLSLLLVSFIAGACLGIAQNTPTSSLLWEITGKNVKSPSYIFGTMHIIPKDNFIFPESLEDKLIHSELLIMEIGGISEQAKSAQLLMLDTGNVFNYFSKEQLDTLFNYTEEHLGYSKEQMQALFGKMKPFFMTQLFSMKHFGESPESYEIKFEQIAKKEGIPVEGLETIEEQMGFINNMPMNDQVKMVMESMRSDNSETKELIEIYLTQDVEKIYLFTTQSSMSTPEFEENFLINRNKKWIKPIQKSIKRNKTFIAVGAAHLGGENGVIELLKKKGYTLTPVKLEK